MPYVPDLELSLSPLSLLFSIALALWLGSLLLGDLSRSVAISAEKNSSIFQAFFSTTLRGLMYALDRVTKLYETYKSKGTINQAKVKRFPGQHLELRISIGELNEAHSPPSFAGFAIYILFDLQSSA